MNKLAKQLIDLGHENPDLRPHIRPVLDQITTSRSASDKMIRKTAAQGKTLQDFISHFTEDIQQQTKLLLKKKGHDPSVLRRIESNIYVMGHKATLIYEVEGSQYADELEFRVNQSVESVAKLLVGRIISR